MLEVCKKETEQKNYSEIPEPKDIITSRIIEKVEYKNDGSKLIKYEKEYTNITKKINETAKMLKQLTAEDKIKELEEILKKGE